MSCRRNAFAVLCNVDRPLAVEYLHSVFALVPSFDELLQLAVLELIRKDSKANSANKVSYYCYTVDRIRIIDLLLVYRAPIFDVYQNC